MVHLIRKPATTDEINSMLDTLTTYIKLAVDVQKEILAGGGEMHADCEEVLLEAGSLQQDIWGADWNPSIHAVEFQSLINIRPGINNSMHVLDENLKDKIRLISERLLGRP